MKELAAETLMLESLTYNLKKKIAVDMCDNEATDSFPSISFAFDFIICLYFLENFS